MKYLLLFTRVVITLIAIAIACIITIVVAIFRPKDPRNSYITTTIGKFLAYPFLNFELNIENQEYMEKNRPCIILPNHQENLDLLIIGPTLPIKTLSLGKKSLIYFPFFGIAYWLCGHYLIDRKNKNSARKTMDKIRQDLIDKKVNIMILPEGTRSKNKIMGPFKKGAFHLAMETNMPIVPMVVSSYHKGLDFSRWKSGVVHIKILEPIPASTFTNENITDQMNQIRLKMIQEKNLLDAQISK